MSDYGGNRWPEQDAIYEWADGRDRVGDLLELAHAVSKYRIEKEQALGDSARELERVVAERSNLSAELRRLREAIEAHRAAGDVWQREAHPYDRKLWSVLDGLPPADSRSGGAQRSAEEG